MLEKVSTILQSLQVNYDVPGRHSRYEIANIQERRVVTAFNAAAMDTNDKFWAMATSKLFSGDHIKNRDIGDIIIVKRDTNELVASIDLKVATFSENPNIYGPINMSSAYKFAGWNGDRVNAFYMLVNGGMHDKVKFISVNKVRDLLDAGGKVEVLFTRDLMTNNHITPEEYASRGWDKNIAHKDRRTYLVDEDYIATKDLIKYTSDIMC